MTIDSAYVPQSFTPNGSRTYTFTFDNIGAQSIVVSYYFEATQSFTRLSAGQYTLTLPTPQAGIYKGGTVVINSAPTLGTTAVVLSRETPVSQLVDYEPYSPFPAEVTEFALDKITLILQEKEFAAGGGGGSSPGGDFIPLAGTYGGKPVTGAIRLSTDGENKSWIIQQNSNLFGVNSLLLGGQGVNSGFYVNTTGADGTSHLFSFTPEGQFYVPSFGAANNEVWVMQGSDFIGTENMLAFYSFDQNTNLRTANPVTFYTSTTEFLSIGTNGKVTVSGVIQPTDPDQTLVTKLYVDNVISGIGGLPTSQPSHILVGDDSGGWRVLNNFLMDDNTIPGLANMNIRGAIAFNNITTPGGFMYIDNEDVLGGEALILYGTKDGDAVVIAPEGKLEPYFVFANGFMTLPSLPTNPSHAANKEYVDSVVGGGGLPPGTVDQTVRHNGTGWEATSVFKVGSSGIVTMSGTQLSAPNAGAAFASVGAGNLTPNGALLKAGGFGVIEPATGVVTLGSTQLDASGSTGAFKTLAATNLVPTGALLKAGNFGIIEPVVGDLVISGVTSIQAANAAGAFKTLGATNLTPTNTMVRAGNFGILEPAGFLSSQVALNTVSISAGDGLTGGGTIAANRTLNVDSTVVRTSGGQSISGAKSFTSAISNPGMPVGTGSQMVVAIGGGIGFLSSDIRLKKNINELQGGLDIIRSLTPIEFDWIGTDQHDVGFAAQHMQVMLPEAVNHNEADDTYGMNYTPVIAALVKAVQELAEMVEVLK